MKTRFTIRLLGVICSFATLVALAFSRGILRRLQGSTRELANDRPHRGRSRAVTAIGMCTIALLASLVGSAAASTPTTVQLGSAGQFAVLAGSVITNAGVSTISGDVGSYPAPTETGFDACPAATCVSLTGVNHSASNDAITQDAKSALATAYDDAAGRTSTLVGTELGAQRLVAGVYRSASGTFSMTGTLVLDGENNPDAVFIFQADSTLITAASANISLVNGAQSSNIFWKVGSSATLGASSTFSGTILAHTSITLGDGVTVDGRVLAGAGAVTMTNATITSPSPAITPPTPITQTDSATASATIGDPISDTATLSGATTDAGGTITFHLYSDAGCTTEISAGLSPVSVNGNGNYNSGNFSPDAVGTYYWTGSYSGDANNLSTSTSCGNAGESSVVGKAPTNIATAQTVIPQDSATISATKGGPSTGSVTFSLYGPNDSSCSGTAVFTQTVSLSGGSAATSNSTFSVSAAAADTYNWLVVYSGDATHSGATSACGTEHFTLTIANG
jgi:hypothetical protein